MFGLLLLDCSVVFVVLFDCSVVFASGVVFVGGFCASPCFLLHEPGGCVLLVF